jgi:hypothetical protein
MLNSEQIKCNKTMTIFDKDNLSKKQSPDWALFLPAISSFYIADIGKQRYGNQVDPTRVPADFEHGVDGLDFLKEETGYFSYKWGLYSAGHANLDLNKFDPKEDVIRKRDRSKSFILGDSGGYQIGMGIWKADWKDPNCPKANAKRKILLPWMEAMTDYSMTLDVPAWLMRKPIENQDATGIHSYQESVTGTFINNDYFINNRTGSCKFLTVLQGETHNQADDWYDKMKKYNDPKQYPGRHFEGYAFGGQNAADVHLILRRLVALKFDGLLEKGENDWIHVLGTSMLEWAVLFTDIQKAARKYYNPNLTISYDCASPFYGASKGHVYYETSIVNREKWAYRMDKGPDDKKYSKDNRRYGDAIRQDQHFPVFTDSPITNRCKISDICVYDVGDLNKMGKESKSAWDSFTYNILQGHNAWCHIKATQDANIAYENGILPNMLVIEQFNRVKFNQIVDEIFSLTDRAKAEKMIDDHSRFWLQIRGTRGNIGKRAINAITHFDNLFE